MSTTTLATAYAELRRLEDEIATQLQTVIDAGPAAARAEQYLRLADMREAQAHLWWELAPDADLNPDAAALLRMAAGPAANDAMTHARSYRDLAATIGGTA